MKIPALSAGNALNHVRWGLNPVTNEINSIYCIRCLNCLELCPANAIKVALRILNG
ncbi:hypothetical protein DRN86_04435 [Candidatus Geothermarchaeota archaeon]|nr:MAG: hypothetical protein DRN86_04435 [Candidatus Geothermarchaeota archaeon]